MANYLSLTNQVLDNLRWDSISQAEFGSPPDPAPAVKRFINQAKDEVLARIGGRLIEKEFTFETDYARTPDNSTAGMSAVATGTSLVMLSGPTALPLTAEMATERWKVILPEVEYDSGGDTGALDPTPHRIVGFTTQYEVTVDPAFTDGEVSSAQTNWAVYRDEYDLDATVRQVVSAWTSNGPLALDFVNNVSELERYYPGDTTFGVPERIAITRSENDGYIWKARLWPAPSQREVIHYQAKFRLPDLTDYDDEWSLEPEILTMIVDRAVMKAVQTPIQNDPDLAQVLGADLNRRTTEWKAEYTPADPNRRIRRQTPGTGSVRIRTVRVSVENP